MSGQAGSILHTMTVLQVYQAKLLCVMDESGPEAAAFEELCSVIDLALSATKSMAQAIVHVMANLVVHEHHLWLNLTEIKDTDAALLDSPVSPSGLFGSAVTILLSILQRHRRHQKRCATSCRQVSLLLRVPLSC